MAKRDQVPFWMAGLVLIWGTAFASIRALGVELTPAQITWYRYVPFLAIFGIWLVVWQRDKLRLVTANDWSRYLAVGMLGVLGYHFPLYYGMQDDRFGPGATAAAAAVLIATTPLWTLLFGLMRGTETMTLRRGLGSLVAFSGVVVVVLLGRGDVEISFARKALLVILAPIFWSWYNIIGKPLVDRHGGLFFTGVSMCMGTLLLVPYGVWIGFDPLQEFTPRLWGWLAYLSLAATVGGYAIWNLALKHRSPSQLTSWIYLIPVIATAAAWIILDEAATVWLLLGAALVLLGVWQVNKKPTVPASSSTVDG